MFYYYGAKKQLAKSYPAPIGTLIVEPFGGSAAYACHHLRMNGDLTAIVLEKDHRVVALWHRLLSMSPDDIRDYPTPRDRFTEGARATQMGVARNQSTTAKFRHFVMRGRGR